MRNISKLHKSSMAFWSSCLQDKKRIIRGKDFPNEYVYKTLLKENLIFKIKKGLYLLKTKSEEKQSLFFRHYWFLIQTILESYEPCSLEKSSALDLYLGNESIPENLFVRTSKNVNYKIQLPFDSKIIIRPDPNYHNNTKTPFLIDDVELSLDLPEYVLLNIKQRTGIKFNAFVKGMNFNKQYLDILYYANPKPIIVKQLINKANELGNEKLGRDLKTILKKHTIYRV
ncbi:MAG: hypothetical protein ABII18_12905 [bacterium]